MSIRLTLSLNVRLIAGCLLMLGFALVLSGSLIVISGTDYVRCDRDVVLLDVFKRVLVSINRVSAERGPINSLIGEPLASSGPVREKLAMFRRVSDESLNAILQPIPGVIDLANDPELVALVDRVRGTLAAARADVDRLTTLPLAQRPPERFNAIVYRMFEAIDLIWPIADRTMRKITADDPSLAGPSLVAFMLVELREYAGRQSAIMMPFVAAQLPLPPQTVIDLARMREHLLTIWKAVSNRAGLYASDARFDALRAEIDAKFFGEGLHFIHDVITAGQETGNFGVTTRQLTDIYVPTFAPIEQLRTAFLEAATNTLIQARLKGLVWLTIVSGLSAVTILSTLALILAGRHYVLRPLMIVCENIIALSKGGRMCQVHSPVSSQEIRHLFEALEELRITLGQREQHTEHLKVLSETDGLTGLMNRRLLERIGQNDPEFADLPHDVSLIMMDLDRFKVINDSFGHVAGDLVLQHAAAIVKRTCREPDLAARYGGEEIAILIMGEDVRDALHIAEGIRAELAAEPVLLPDGRRVYATASFGVAQGTRGGPNWLNLVKSADAALYQAKTFGRNRVCCAYSAMSTQTRNVA